MLGAEPLEDRRPILEVELRRRLADQPGEPLRLEVAPYGRPHEPTVSRYVEDCLPIERLRLEGLVRLDGGCASDWARRNHPHAPSRSRGHPSSSGWSIHGLPSCLRASISASTMMRARCSVSTVAFHPRSRSALPASPTSASTSVG